MSKNAPSSNSATAPSIEPVIPSHRIFGFLDDRPLRVKLILVFLVVTALSVGAVAYFTSRVMQTELTKGVGSNLHNLALIKGQAISDLLIREVDTLQAFGLSKIMQDGVEEVNNQYTDDTAAIQALIDQRDQQWRAADTSDPLIQEILHNPISSELREYRDTFPTNVEVFVTDKYGALLAASDRTSDYYQADEDWWKAAYNNGQGAIYIGQPEFDQSSKTNSLIIAVPLVGHGTQKITGVLRTTFRLKTLTDLLTVVRFGQSGDTDLLLPNGQLLRSEGDIIMAEPAALASLKDMADTGYAEFVYDGGLKFVSRASITAIDPKYADPIAALHWLMVVNQDPDEAFQPVNAALQATLLVGVIAILCVTLLAFIFARALVAPLDRLTQGVRQITAGDLSQRVVIEQRDEIGILADSFNTMAQSLEDRIAAEQVAQIELQHALAEVEARANTQKQLLTENQQQRETIREISVPVLPIMDSTLVIPLVGILDSDRLQLLQSQALQAIEHTAARTLILDITGVLIVDSQVAQGLLAVVQAARLLGAEVLLVGVRPEVAQAIVGLGLHLPGLRSYSNLQSALSRTSA